MTRLHKGNTTTPKTHKMNMRKVLQFNDSIGFTIPKQFGHALNIKHGDYVEVYLRDNKTMVIKKHGIAEKKITIDDK